MINNQTPPDPAVILHRILLRVPHEKRPILSELAEEISLVPQELRTTRFWWSKITIGVSKVIGTAPHEQWEQEILQLLKENENRETINKL